MSSLKSQALQGFKWSSVQNFGTQILQLISTIVLARLISPEAYGVVGILMVFVAISNVLIVGGLTNSLIRDNEATEEDYSTVFLYNLFISIICYVLLFFLAPYAANYFRMELLSPVLRVAGISLIFNAFTAVQQAKLTKELNFKVQMKIGLSAQFVSTLVAIVLAYLDFGVWALVCMTLISSFLTSLLLWSRVAWIPSWRFSSVSFKKHFGFGSKLLCSGLLDTVYNNVYPIVIGRLFSGADLGYYTRANSFAALPMSSINGVITKVSFPLLSKMQDDTERLRINFRKLIRMIMFLVAPIMLGLFAISSPLIEWLVSDKWLPCVPYLKVLCFVFLLYPVHSLNLNILQVLGRSDIFLKLEIIKKVLGVTILCLTAPFGILVMCYGALFTSILALGINTFYTNRLINLSLWQQLRDIAPSILIAGCMSVVALFVQELSLHLILKISYAVLSGAIFYLIMSRLFIHSEWNEVESLVKAKLYGNK